MNESLTLIAAGEHLAGEILEFTTDLKGALESDTDSSKNGVRQ